MATERLIPVRRLRPDERPRAAAGRESVWIDGTWHSARRNAPSTACGRHVGHAEDPVVECTTCAIAELGPGIHEVVPAPWVGADIAAWVRRR